jgi:hypothetical protein
LSLHFCEKVPPHGFESPHNSHEFHPTFSHRTTMAFFQSKQAKHSAVAADLDYLLTERVSSQWIAFLAAFSAEIQNQLTPQEYRELLRSMGQRYAAAMDIGARDTVDGMAAGINEQLRAVQWGHVKLADNGDLLLIEHHLSPLPKALEVDPDLAGGFLQGMYEHWFKTAGADDALSVKAVAGASTNTLTVFQFGHHA